jgi:GT2 family glycosyltransferase
VAENFFVTAILVSHDGATWLPETIAAIFSQTRPIDRIVAVDNGSIDNSIKLIEGAGIPVIMSDRESGFGDAIDIALGRTKSIAAGEQEELIWILHDDCAPSRTALKFLIEGLSDNPQIAYVGPKLRGWYDRNHLLEVGISIAVNGARWTGLEPGEKDQGQHDDAKDVLAVSTAAMLAKRKIFETLGGLDPNLALFRDDVDLGWRTRVAGYSVVTVPQALVFHAEASASERRSVNVEEAFLGRPRLLDRRNAAFVLLANVSWWLLPWVAIQLLGAAMIRAIGYLIAKLPGYAGDELVAVALIVLKPADLIKARRVRKTKRLLSVRTIRQYIPPRGSQMRLAIEKVSGSISKYLHLNVEEEVLSEPLSYADIGVIDESFDDQDSQRALKTNRFKTLRNRPLLFGLGIITAIAVLAARNRYGALSGGALPVSPEGASDLVRKFSESWHQVGLGSAAPAPTWVGILGLACLFTLGKVKLFVALLFWLTPPLAFLVMYRAIKRTGLTIRFSVLGGLLYAMSPVVWNSISEGRLGTLVIALAAPTFVSLAPLHVASKNGSWRRIYFLALFASFISAFSALFLIIWSAISSFFIILELFKGKKNLVKFSLKQFLLVDGEPKLKRFLAFLIIPILLNAPWSASLLIHPTQILLDPGLPISSGSLTQLLLLNPGGASGVPTWIVAPFIIFLLITVFSNRYVGESIVALSFLAIAIAVAQIHISGHGSNGTVWNGTLLLFIEIIILPPALKISSTLIPNLRGSALGVGHFASAVTAIIVIFSLVGTTAWAITNGANSLVTSGKKAVIPAFVSSLSESPARPKTLVLGMEGRALKYFITRGRDLEIGDPDVTVATPPEIENAVAELISGVGISSSKVIGAYGIQYIFMKAPINSGIVRTIDGIGGFTRSSVTTDGVIWKVVGSRSRLSLFDPASAVTPLAASDVGATASVSSPGVITLAEKYDSGWRILFNGVPLKLEKSNIGLPTFAVSDAGTLNLSHDGTRRRALVSMELISLFSVIILALPAGRRRREMDLKELA